MPPFWPADRAKHCLTLSSCPPPFWRASAPRGCRLDSPIQRAFLAHFIPGTVAKLQGGHVPAHIVSCPTAQPFKQHNCSFQCRTDTEVPTRAARTDPLLCPFPYPSAICTNQTNTARHFSDFFMSKYDKRKHLLCSALRQVCIAKRRNTELGLGDPTIGKAANLALLGMGCLLTLCISIAVTAIQPPALLS